MKDRVRGKERYGQIDRLRERESVCVRERERGTERKRWLKKKRERERKKVGQQS